MPQKTGLPRRVKTCDTVFDIIEFVMSSDGASITQTAENLDLAPSTVHGHLTTLEDRGLLVKEDKRYYLGMKFFNYGTRARERLHVVDVARSEMEELASVTEETVWLGVREGDEYVLAEKAMGERGIQTKGEVGARFPIHAGAIGKVFLAYMPDEEAAEFVEADHLERLTQHTITDGDELSREIETIPQEGVAFSDNEITEGIRGVAAPILLDEIHGVIYLSGPAGRLTGSYFREELPELVRGATHSIDLKLQYE